MTIVDSASEMITTPSGKDWVQHAVDLADRIRPFAAGHDRDSTFVSEAFELIKSEGFTSALVPTEFGGGGVTHSEAGAILRELGKGCPSTAVTLSMHYHLVATQVWRHNHGQVAAPILRRIAAENLLLISTGATDWVDSYGEAVAVDGGFRVTVKKTPSSGAPAGDILVASAPWADAPDGPQVIHFAIPFAAEGVTIENTWDVMGLRGTGSETVALENVFVPDAAVSLTRPSGQWHPLWDAVLGSALPLIMSAYVGIAEAATELTLETATAKSSDAHIVPLVGQMMNHLTLGRDIVEVMLTSSENLTFAANLDHSTATLSRKTIATDALIDTVRVALEICGGRGFGTEMGLERLYRDVHGALYHPLHASKQKLFTGRHTLGMNPLG